ncbi:hypothetical protein [Streptomyces montanus]|uniref:hypothetical protein n=1 Tax=Streptomyces montanus TaxID=2580423 RepID=UPI0014875C78|nr:hypothetical protein [Streptomyces montanus]
MNASSHTRRSTPLLVAVPFAAESLALGERLDMATVELLNRAQHEGLLAKTWRCLA